MLVTIGLPVYNSADTVVHTIRSIFAQTLSDWELIIVDDGSTDDSLAIAASVRDDRVRVCHDGLNLGLPARLNQISNLARGTYLARMDADDLMHPERLEAQVAYIEAHPDVHVVDTSAYLLDETGTTTVALGLRPQESSPSAALRASILIHPCVMARTEWFRQNPYDPAYRRAQDHELWCRVFRTTRFGRVRRPLLFKRDLETFTLEKYLSSSRTDLRIIRRFGPELVGWPRTLILTVMLLAKGELYRLATALGHERLLIRKRYERLPPADAAAARLALAAIHATAIPGIDSV